MLLQPPQTNKFGFPGPPQRAHLSWRSLNSASDILSTRPPILSAYGTPKIEPMTIRVTNGAADAHSLSFMNAALTSFPLPQLHKGSFPCSSDSGIDFLARNSQFGPCFHVRHLSARAGMSRFQAATSSPHSSTSASSPMAAPKVSSTSANRSRLRGSTYASATRVRDARSNRRVKRRYRCFV